MNTDVAAQHALDRLAKVGLDGLTEPERILAVVWTFAAGVGNGGFKGYFASRRGDLAFLAPNALRRIGADHIAEIASEANALLGVDGPARDRAARREAIHALAPSARARLTELDESYERTEEDVDDLLERFLAKRHLP